MTRFTSIWTDHTTASAIAHLCAHTYDYPHQHSDSGWECHHHDDPDMPRCARAREMGDCGGCSECSPPWDDENDCPINIAPLFDLAGQIDIEEEPRYASN